MDVIRGKKWTGKISGGVGIFFLKNSNKLKKIPEKGFFDSQTPHP